MTLPDWVAGTGWGFFILIIALLLSQAKVFGDLWIWRKSQNRVDSYLNEIAKALTIEKDMQDCPEVAQDIRHFVATSSKYIKDYNVYRISQERRLLTRVTSGGNALLARKASLLVRNVSWFLLSLYGLYFGGTGVVMVIESVIGGWLFEETRDIAGWLYVTLGIVVIFCVFVISSLSSYWSLKSLWYGGLGHLFSKLVREPDGKKNTD